MKGLSKKNQTSICACCVRLARGVGIRVQLGVRVVHGCSLPHTTSSQKRPDACFGITVSGFGLRQQAAQTSRSIKAYSGSIVALEVSGRGWVGLARSDLTGRP